MSHTKSKPSGACRALNSTSTECGEGARCSECYGERHRTRADRESRNRAGHRREVQGGALASAWWSDCSMGRSWMFLGDVVLAGWQELQVLPKFASDSCGLRSHLPREPSTIASGSSGLRSHSLRPSLSSSRPLRPRRRVHPQYEDPERRGCVAGEDLHG